MPHAVYDLPVSLGQVLVSNAPSKGKALLRD